LFAISEIPTPWMTLRKRLPDAVPRPGVTLSRVCDVASLQDVVQVSQEAWAPVGLPPAETASLLARRERLLAPHLAWVVAHLDGRPAATAMVLCSHGVAGVYWVGTTPDARRRGLAELVTRTVGNFGLDAGMRVAALQASQMGHPVYARMGYETVSHTRWYLVRPARR
jgi:GNAT superfamily N-acetyltransferase